MVIQYKRKKILLSDFVLKEHSVIQKYIDQHQALSEISPSTNTIRIVTLLTKDHNVLIIGAVLRFGIGNSYVDNISIGGIAAGIDIKHGILKSTAYDSKGRIYETHPTSGVRFDYFQIPYWHEVLDLANKIQLSFPFYKLLGSDIAITKIGPVIIELNGAHDNVGLEQKCVPILTDKSVRAEFEKYDLLINKLNGC